MSLEGGREGRGREGGDGGGGGMTVIHIILMAPYIGLQTNNEELYLYNNDVTYYVITCNSAFESSIFNLQWFRPEKASAVLGVCVTCIVGACGSVSVYLQHCEYNNDVTYYVITRN